MALTWLDAVLLIALLVIFIIGYRNGFWISAGRVLGFTAGAIGAFFLIPLSLQLVPNPTGRLIIMALVLIAFISVGMIIGAGIARAIRLRMSNPTLRTLDRFLGAGMSVVVAGLVISGLSYSVASVGIPSVTETLRKSQVISTITRVTPDGVWRAVSSVRSALVDTGVIPEIAPSIEPDPDSTPRAPQPATQVDLEVTAAVEDAEASTVRIAGTAYECGVNQTGSGFAIEPNRVVTNAHVVAGVSRPTVESAEGDVFETHVVYFDPDRDLAVLSLIDGGVLPALDVGQELGVGDGAFALGYPAGGPYDVIPSVVQAVGPATLTNIYGEEASLRDIYQLESDIRQGNSGGPLVDPDGDVIGVVFAKAPEGGIGYAMTTDEVGDVLQGASGYTERVSTGTCLS